LSKKLKEQKKEEDYIQQLKDKGEDAMKDILA
jgi:hypothetical protein